jgi:hypothetical protein
MDATWAPDACTLPTAERLFRVAEFDDLFAEHLRRADRPDAQTLDLFLDPESRPTVEDLVARESACCSFFTFTLTGTTELQLRICVPPDQIAVLDGMLR